MTTSFTHDTQDLAETYDRLSDPQLDGGKRLIERIGIKPGNRVLDIGCGTGRLVAAWIAERVGPTGTVVGIDPRGAHRSRPCSHRRCHVRDRSSRGPRR